MSDELSHYGKKGMKWGVINEDDTTSKSNKSNKSAKPSTSKVTKDEYIEALKARPKHTKAEQEKLIAKDKEKFKAKFEQSGQKTQDETKPKKGWRPTKQQLAIAGIGAAYVGLVAASMYVENKGPSYQFQSAPKVADILRNPVFSKPGKLAISAGEHCSVSQYSSLIDGSISRSWGGRYFNDYSWERPELSFPRLTKTLAVPLSRVLKVTFEAPQTASETGIPAPVVARDGAHDDNLETTISPRPSANKISILDILEPPVVVLVLALAPTLPPATGSLRTPHFIPLTPK